MSWSTVAAASTGVARSWKTAVVVCAQVTSGRRPQVIPGARRRTIVVRKFSPPMMDENPRRKIASSQQTWPIPDPGAAASMSASGG